MSQIRDKKAHRNRIATMNPINAKEVCQNAHLFFYAQSPDFHKQGLCYYLKILYL